MHSFLSWQARPFYEKLGYEGLATLLATRGTEKPWAQHTSQHDTELGYPGDGNPHLLVPRTRYLPRLMPGVERFYPRCTKLYPGGALGHSYGPPATFL
jgi:hypothetical protein